MAPKKRATDSADGPKVRKSSARTKAQQLQRAESATKTHKRSKASHANGMLREEAAPYRVHSQGSPAKLRFIDLFAGIGGIRIGLERSGGSCVFSSEWDRDAACSYEAFFGERPAGDITKVPNSDIPDHDILAGGFPCQA